MDRVVYIASHCNSEKDRVQFAISRSKAFGQRWAYAVCVSCSQYLLLRLAIVSECAGKLTAYLCRAAEGPTAATEEEDALVLFLVSISPARLLSQYLTRHATLVRHRMRFTMWRCSFMGFSMNQLTNSTANARFG